MATKLKEKIEEEIKEIPEELIPNFYRILKSLKKEITKKGKIRKTSSLKGIWGKILIPESLFKEAKQSLFPFEKNNKI